MDRQVILDLLVRRPFQPFAVQLSNGELFEVRHPELAALGKSRLVIVNPVTDGMETVALLHVSNVRTLQAA